MYEEEAFEQTEQIDTNFRICIGTHPKRMLSHWHSYVELMFFYETIGCTYRIRDREYVVHKGDLIVVNSLENHSCADFGSAVVCCLVLEPELLGGYRGVLFRHQVRADPVLEELFGALRQIQPYDTFLDLQDHDPRYFHALSGLYGILARLIDGYIYDAASIEGRLSNGKQVRQMMHYIGEHYAEAICIADLAALVNLSESRAAHIFREVTGSSIMAYTEHIRLERAKELLCEGEGSITEIAQQTGYSTHSYFTSRFRRQTGMTPTEYRHRWLET